MVPAHLHALCNAYVLNNIGTSQIFLDDDDDKAKVRQPYLRHCRHLGLSVQ